MAQTSKLLKIANIHKQIEKAAVFFKNKKS